MVISYSYSVDRMVHVGTTVGRCWGIGRKAVTAFLVLPTHIFICILTSTIASYLHTSNLSMIPYASGSAWMSNSSSAVDGICHIHFMSVEGGHYFLSVPSVHT